MGGRPYRRNAVTLRITIACPEHLTAPANQFALCVGNTSADVHTFGDAMWEDERGARYALVSLLAEPQFAEVAAQPLRAPDHADDADIAAASVAQAALRIWSPLSPGSFPSLAADCLIAITGLDAGFAVPLLGLSPVPVAE